MISKDGFFVDTETGEILGHEGITSPAWSPETPQDVEWLLELMQEQDATAMAQRARIKAITENLETLAKAAERKKDYLLFRYHDALRVFAEKVLEGQKTRTYTTPYGKLSFRKTQGSIKVADGQIDYALDWCEKHAPEAIKVSRSVLVTPLKGIEKLPDCFEVTEAEDKFSVTTGVG